MTSALVIGGDVGGTNSRLALYEIPTAGLKLTEGTKAPGNIVFSKWYPNSDFKSFTDIFKTFLKDAATETKAPVEDVVSACVAVAGPVSNNKVTMTNRGAWVISGEELGKELGIPKVLLVNDFVALGYGLLTVNRKSSKEVTVLQDAPPQPGAPIACIGAGTGLGECFLTPGEGGHYVAYPTEGGHAEFPPRTEVEFELLRYLKNKFSQKHRVSVERVISGPGIANVYEFLAKQFPDKVDQELHKKFLDAGEHGGRVVAEGAVDPKSLASQAMDIFISAYGGEAGVAGLKWMPFGGLFITGGLTPKNISRIAGPKSAFMEAFHDKGRVSPFLKNIPMYAVLVEDLGERGAHWVAVKLLLEQLGLSGKAVVGAGPAATLSPDVLTAIVAASVSVVAVAAVAAIKLLKK